jgi:hypothetical protein
LQFAIGINGVQLGGTARYFDFVLEQVSITGNNGTQPILTTTQILLLPCNLETWSSFGTNFKQQFTVFGMDKMLCVANGSSVSMQGYAGSSNYQYLTLRIKTCANKTF